MTTESRAAVRSIVAFWEVPEFLEKLDAQEEKIKQQIRIKAAGG